MFGPRPPSGDCLSNLALDRLLVEELEDHGRAAAMSHVSGCRRCSARLRELGAERDRFAAEARPLALPPGLAAPRRPLSGRALFAGGAVALGAAVVILLFVGRGGDAIDEQSIDATRVKGRVRLGLYIKRGDVVIEGRSGDVVHPGDALRFAYTSTSARYLIILGRDGAGRVSVYFPEHDRAAPIPAGEDALLPGSMVLDDVRGREEIVALDCDEPVAAAAAVEGLRAARGSPARIAGCAVERIILDKRP
jgi:hypothetical protein